MIKLGHTAIIKAKIANIKLNNNHIIETLSKNHFGLSVSFIKYFSSSTELELSDYSKFYY